MTTDTVIAPEVDAIEAVIDEAIVTEETPKTEEPKTEEPTAEEGAEAQAAQEEPVKEKKFEGEPFPKKAVSAISRRDKTIVKLKEENLRLTQAQLKVPPPEVKQDGPISEDDFETYGEYLKAVNNQAMDERFAEYEKNQTTARQTEQNAQWKAERQVVVSEQATKMMEEIPDYADVFTENADVIDNFSPEVQDLFLEADNAPLAFYTLAKEGTLENLLSMSPMQAAMVIGSAIERGSNVQQPKKISKAPTPMTGVSGTGGNSNNPASMSPDDLVKWAGVD